eukprot:GHVL01020884.1.p1 GENE.GHVL01020884.1~~GHVL01020884.1.p1  ORF type:complete len:751 (-),score=101.40 GHVL01020884.1:28-2280(-)
MWTLMCWMIGLVMYWAEKFGINHVYLLNIEPRCMVKSGDLFNVACIQTFFCIVAFGLFIADYRFFIFGHHDLYFFYPVSLTCAHTILILWPSNVFRSSYRLDIIKLMGLTMLCGLWPFAISAVTFPSNLMGNILTSFVKPLADFEYILCYWSWGIGKITKCSVKYVQNYGWDDSCASLTYKSFLYHDKKASCSEMDQVLKMFITVFPYWIRLMQCAHRLFCARRNEKLEIEKLNMASEGAEKHLKKIRTEKAFQRLQMANCGKYTVSLCVILLAQAHKRQWIPLPYSKIFMIIGLISATVYSFTWDVLNDWGFPCKRKNRKGFILRERRLLPDHYYYIFCAINLIGRCSWTVTLLPIELINDKDLNEDIILTIISALELYRRAQWVTIRLDYEHLENKSKFRSLLYVPKLPQPSQMEHQYKAKRHYDFGRLVASEERTLSEKETVSVYQVRDIQNGNEYAMKRIICRERQAFQITKREAVKMLPLKHDNIVTLHNWKCNVIDGGRSREILLLMEMCNDPPLFMLDYPISETVFLQILKQISCGIEYLHQLKPPLIHRNLKITNILCKSGIYKICDFKASTNEIFDKKNCTRDELLGLQDEIEKSTTMIYRPPEMADLYSKYFIGQPADIWMLGCIVYQLVYEKHPFEAGVLAITNGTYTIPYDSRNWVNTRVVPLIHWMLTVDPNKRPTAEDIFCIAAEWQNFNTSQFQEIIPSRPEKYSSKRVVHKRDDSVVEQPLLLPDGLPNDTSAT